MDDELGPRVDTSFSPTAAFVREFGEEEAKEQAKVFTAPTWARHLSGAGDEARKDKPMVEEGDDGISPNTSAMLVLSGLFLAGAVVGSLVGWRCGKATATSNGATSMLPSTSIVP